MEKPFNGEIEVRRVGLRGIGKRSGLESPTKIDINRELKMTAEKIEPE